jgi:hypothetical protein
LSALQETRKERTTGTVNPGVIYVADKFQLGFEAIIPVNRASGDGVGVIGQLHLYLDDIFPIQSAGRCSWRRRGHQDNEHASLALSLSF